MSEQITLDLGVKTYEIKDPDGNVTGTVRFNPSDPGFAGRWQQAMAKIESYRKKIEEMRAAGTPEIDLWSVLMEASDAIKKSFDYAFGAPVSAAFFGGASAFAMTQSGRLVIENVVEGVYPIIEKALDIAGSRIKMRMDAHTLPYADPAKGLAPGQDGQAGRSGQALPLAETP